MELNTEERAVVVSTALSYLGRPYNRKFQCIDFAREVYRTVGIEIPKLSGDRPVPQDINIRHDDLVNPPIGHMLFLRRKGTRSTRLWTHAVIILPGSNCIHCSHFFGGKVVISSMGEILAFYDYVPSE